MYSFNFNRYMATRESLRSLGFTFWISQSYITGIIQLILKSSSSRLPGILLKPPSKDLIKTAREFWEKWNFPNCVGSIDGKHIRISCPGKSDSLFFSYKDFFSIVLLAIVDANCKFIYVDIGSYGKESDSGIFSSSSLYKLIKQGNYFLPNEKLPTSSQTLHIFMLGTKRFVWRHIWCDHTHAEKPKKITREPFLIIVCQEHELRKIILDSRVKYY